jgi:hypothetical protein
LICNATVCQARLHANLVFTRQLPAQWLRMSVDQTAVGGTLQKQQGSETHGSRAAVDRGGARAAPWVMSGCTPAICTRARTMAHCKGQIASDKVPRAVYFMAPGQWPMCATKVNPQILRERWMAMQAVTWLSRGSRGSSLPLRLHALAEDA